MQDLLGISVEELRRYKVSDWAYTELLEPVSYDRFEKWIEDKLHGPLNYLSDERKEKRKTLRNIYPECEGAISFLFNYIDSKKSQLASNSEYKVASYVTGFEDQDYHFWIKDKLQVIGEKLKEEFPGLDFKITLDVHPVLERDLAFRSGLGWFGKNSMLISKEYGSYTLIGSLLINQRLPGQSERLIEADHCGSCTRCIDACPTNAIDPNKRHIDSNKCISTFTIETFKDGEPPKGYPAETQEIFGCDICQEVCPWNRKPLLKADELEDSKIINFFNRDLVDIITDIEGMSNKVFKTFFFGTSFSRGGKRALLKNLRYYLKT